MSPNISPNIWFETVIRRCLCSQRDTAEHAQRHFDENKRRCLAKCLLEWSNISNISHNNEKQNLFLTQMKLCPTLPNKCYETKQGGQTSQTFHQTFVFELLGEMFDLFDQGYRETISRFYLSVFQRRFHIVWWLALFGIVGIGWQKKLAICCMFQKIDKRMEG